MHTCNVGNPINQLYGLIAERLFVDQAESTTAQTGLWSIHAGDIKYKDVNNDG